MQPPEHQPAPAGPRLACAALFVVTTTCCAAWAWASGVGDRPTIREWPGSIQVLASSDELWLFVEVDHIVRRRTLSENPFLEVGHHQVVAVVTSSAGEATVTRVHPNGGPSFHGNHGAILHVDGRAHIFWGPSPSRDSVVWRWNPPRFEWLEADENAAFLRDHDLAHMTWRELDANVAAVNHAAGWTLLIGEDDPMRFDEERREYLPIPDDDLVWAGRTYRWALEHDEGRETVGLRVAEDGADRWIPLITYDPRERVVERE